jgi:AmmeMemoRadiSam system protein B
MKPKIRNVDAHVVRQAGQQSILLRDPLRLSSQAVLLPCSLAPLLQLCDGTRDESELRAALAVRAGVQLGAATLDHILAQLDEACLLDNKRFAEAESAALQRFRTSTYRAPILAGNGYPADPDELTATLEGFLDTVSHSDQEEKPRTGEIRGLVSPHIDFDRGWRIYAQVWKQAAEAIREAELIIIFGTDHMSAAPGMTFTHQRYATPWGALPTANNVVDAVARSIGPDAAFRYELHHRGEHSIELAVIWLHHLLGDRQCELVPVLCGSFDELVRSAGSPAENSVLSSALAILQQAATSRSTIVVAAGDLAHVGPAFGDPYPVDLFQRAQVKAADERLMDHICSGDEEAFFEEVKASGDRTRVCGFPPIYLALRLLGEADGTVTGYAQCAADQQNGSFVSICGIVLE